MLVCKNALFLSILMSYKCLADTMCVSTKLPESNTEYNSSEDKPNCWFKGTVLNSTGKWDVKTGKVKTSEGLICTIFTLIGTLINTQSLCCGHCHYLDGKLGEFALTHSLSQYSKVVTSKIDSAVCYNSPYCIIGIYTSSCSIVETCTVLKVIDLPVCKPKAIRSSASNICCGIIGNKSIHGKYGC